MRAIILGLAIVSASAFAQDVVFQTDLRQQKLDAEKVATQTFAFLGGQFLNGKVIKAAPYSAESVTESTQTLTDGNKIVNKSSTMMYRDSEGRERREESIGNLGGLGNATSNATPVKAVFISDPVAKVTYSLDPQAKTARKSGSTSFTVNGAAGGATMTTSGAMSVVMRDEHVINQTIVAGRAGGIGGQAIGYSYRVDADHGDGPTKPAPNTEQLGTKMIEGVSAEGTRTTITIPAGQIGNERDIVITHERWYSPDLQMTVMTRSSDPRSGETVYRMTNISRSEPMPSLFEVPSDYKTIEQGGTLRKVIKDE